MRHYSQKKMSRKSCFERCHEKGVANDIVKEGVAIKGETKKKCCENDVPKNGFAKKVPM